MHRVEELTDGAVRMGPGTLYGAIKRMLADGLIEETDERPDPALDDQRRRYYRLTAAGEHACAAEVQRIETSLRHARTARAEARTPPDDRRTRVPRAAAAVPAPVPPRVPRPDAPALPRRASRPQRRGRDSPATSCCRAPAQHKEAFRAMSTQGKLVSASRSSSPSRSSPSSAVGGALFALGTAAAAGVDPRPAPARARGANSSHTASGGSSTLSGVGVFAVRRAVLRRSVAAVVARRRPGRARVVVGHVHVRHRARDDRRWVAQRRLAAGRHGDASATDEVRRTLAGEHRDRALAGELRHAPPGRLGGAADVRQQHRVRRRRAAAGCTSGSRS